ncbi:MAG: hypothetical protein IJ725_02115 [Ruminococcus sp.]|nr:hypothetical protein [Ruminococcus sp.]
MKTKSLVSAEIIGFFVAAAGVVFLWNVYDLSGKSTISIVLGAVNSSIWEKTKCIFICCLLCGLTELLCVKPRFRQFVTAKVLGLSMSMLVFIILNCFADDLASLCAAFLCGFVCSCVLTLSKFRLNRYFAPACFLLMLLFMMTFSFTAFAPKLPIFRDPYTGCYGIIPQSFDMGALSLNI